MGGVGMQTVRDWVLRFNAQGPDGLLDGKAPGPRPVLGSEHKRALAEVIEQGPIRTTSTNRFSQGHETGRRST
jgi:transposase